MTLNRVKLGRAVTFMKYLASVVSLIFLPKTLIWNKITFPASNLLSLAELVVNKPKKIIYKNNYQYSFSYLIYHCLKLDFHLPKIFFHLLQWKPFKNDEKCILKALFVLKIFKLLSWLFARVEKKVWIER